MKREVEVNTLPELTGPYPYGVEIDGFIFISGQLPIVPSENRLAKGLNSQFRQSMDNIESILASKNLSMDNIVKTTIFLTDLTKIVELNEIYIQYFNKPYPARSTFQVSGLPMGALVEIEAIAKL